MSTCMTAILLCQHRQREGWTAEQRRGSCVSLCFCSYDFTLIAPLTLPTASVSYMLIQFIHYIVQFNFRISNGMFTTLQLFKRVKGFKYFHTFMFWNYELFGRERKTSASICEKHMMMDESLSCCWPFPQRLRQLNVFISDSLRLHRPC